MTRPQQWAQGRWEQRVQRHRTPGLPVCALWTLPREGAGTLILWTGALGVAVCVWLLPQLSSLPLCATTMQRLHVTLVHRSVCDRRRAVCDRRGALSDRHRGARPSPCRGFDPDGRTAVGDHRVLCGCSCCAAVNRGVIDHAHGCGYDCDGRYGCGGCCLPSSARPCPCCDCGYEDGDGRRKKMRKECASSSRKMGSGTLVEHHSTKNRRRPRVAAQPHEQRAEHRPQRQTAERPER